MKTTTTTREYDDEGRMIRETIVEQDSTASSLSCTCGPYAYWCQMHGYRTHAPMHYYSPTITTGTSPYITINTTDGTAQTIGAAAAAGLLAGKASLS